MTEVAEEQPQTEEQPTAPADPPPSTDEQPPAPAPQSAGPMPTIGRIVHYRVNGEEFANNQSPIAAAVVVRVWGPDCVNLRILTDGGEVVWKTSVVRGDADGQWSWPPRS